MRLCKAGNLYAALGLGDDVASLIEWHRMPPVHLACTNCDAPLIVVDDSLAVVKKVAAPTFAQRNRTLLQDDKGRYTMACNEPRDKSACLRVSIAEEGKDTCGSPPRFTPDVLMFAGGSCYHNRRSLLRQVRMYYMRSSTPLCLPCARLSKQKCMYFTRWLIANALYSKQHVGLGVRHCECR